MKKTGIVFALFAIVLTTGAGARAQRPSLKTSLVTQGPVTQAPDLSKLNIDKILQQLQSTKVQPSSEETSLQVVAEFLQLSPSQISELEQFAANAPGEASAAFPERTGFDPTVGSHAEFRRKPGAGRNRSNPNPRVAAADGAGATGFPDTIHCHARPGTIAKASGRPDRRATATYTSGVSVDFSVLTLNSEVEQVPGFPTHVVGTPINQGKARRDMQPAPDDRLGWCSR